MIQRCGGSQTELKILYDNEAKEGFRSGWGFSCLIGENLLFDTGADMNTLLFNMQKFDVNFNEINKVVFSHEHEDHTGGFRIIKKLGNVEVYVLGSFSRNLKSKIASFANVKLREVKELAEISDGIFTTGELGFFTKEQSLIIKTEKGVVVITGCSHPGLEKILSVASKFGRNYGVIGGFHTFNKLEILRDTTLIVPCHCTTRKMEILKRYPNSTLRCSAGCIIEI